MDWCLTGRYFKMDYVLINRTIQYITVIHWNLKNIIYTKNINPIYVSMRFGVFMIEKIQMVCLDISGSLTSGYQRFRGTHCLHLQGIYWRYVTEKRWWRLPGHTLTSKNDYNICFRLCYNAIHIAICVLQPWHQHRYRVSVFSITTKLKKESTYPLDHYTWHFQWDKYFSISYIKTSQATKIVVTLRWFLLCHTAFELYVIPLICNLIT